MAKSRTINVKMMQTTHPDGTQTLTYKGTDGQLHQLPADFDPAADIPEPEKEIYVISKSLFSTLNNNDFESLKRAVDEKKVIFYYSGAMCAAYSPSLNLIILRVLNFQGNYCGNDFVFVITRESLSSIKVESFGYSGAVVTLPSLYSGSIGKMEHDKIKAASESSMGVIAHANKLGVAVSVEKSNSTYGLRFLTDDGVKIVSVPVTFPSDQSELAVTITEKKFALAE